MATLSLAVLSALAVLTVAMGWYLYAYLPRRLEERTFESISAFSLAIELRFPSHQGLTARVVPLALAVGRLAGLSGRRLRNLELAAQLRDIGLCAVPYRLINAKSFMRWSDSEQAVYAKHAALGASMIEKAPTLRHLAKIVRSHHADAGSDPGIPLEAKVLRCVVDYIWCERWQGEMLARTQLQQGAGTAYDPRVVGILMDVLISSRAAQPAQELAAATR